MIPGANRIILDAARSIVTARQQAEVEEVLRRHADEMAPIERLRLNLLAAQRRELILLGRQHIAERDILATATGSA